MGGDLLGKSRLESCHTGDIGLVGCLAALAHDHFIDLFRVDPAAFHAAFDHRAGKIHATVSADHLHGIGLAIAKQVAEVMGAEIEAANRPEGGAVFTLRLQRPAPTTP